ncbi:GH25 family lysozyme [Curtobacterium sp. S6]|uniref:GH25 family lysozyme n=1 Tax=Curtobacterium sp. S6 TaxID=1479623 RepID=UPI0006925664|nr:GH25 family lysozyme [Curtobacterium sp. S6]
MRSAHPASAPSPRFRRRRIAIASLACISLLGLQAPSFAETQPSTAATPQSSSAPVGEPTTTPASASPSATPSATPTVAGSSTSALGAVTNGHENAQVAKLVPESDVLKAPSLGTTPPRTGGSNPGATMGQGTKPLESTDHLSPASVKSAAQDLEKAKSGQNVEPNKASAVDNPGEQAETGGTAATSGVQGMDVSGWQSNVNWYSEYANGARFASVKTTEGIGYVSPTFSSQYNGAGNAGMYRGGYHFALPSQSSGAEQADFFVNNGGGWSADGRTLPGMLDIEFNPYSSLGNTCYNMSPGQMNAWISSFTTQYKNRTGRYPAIYTNSSWWSTCTGNTSQFSAMPLHISYYASTPGPMPAGWSTYDIWQYSASGPFSGDSNVFNGDAAGLRNYVTNAGYKPIGGTGTPVSTDTYTAPNGRVVTLRAAIGGLWNTNRAKYGDPVNNETCGLVNGGCYQTFANGYTIYWAPNGKGAHTVKTWGAIGQKWMQAGYERGYGYPVNEESCGLIGGGCFQAFSNGQTVYWTPNSNGARTVKTWGAIGQKWMQAGYERGYGYPVNDEQCNLIGGGCFQAFSNGQTVYWTPNSNGAHSVNTRGAIGQKGIQAGFERGYGHPVNDEQCNLIGGGCFQAVSNGQTVYWTPNSNGAHTVNTRGAIGQKWIQAGFERGYGYPVNDEQCNLIGGGCFQAFSNGQTVYWTPNSNGAHTVNTRGAIGEKWMQAGFERGYGYPLTEEVCGLVNGGCFQTYSNGHTVYWTPNGTGTHAVYTWGAIGKEWMQAGYERGYGYPTTDRTASGGQYTQKFSNGKTLTKAS